MTLMARLLIVWAMLLLCDPPAFAAPAPSDAAVACYIGAYRQADGGVIDIAAAAGAGKLRWRRTDGTTGELTQSAGGGWTSTLGWTGKPDGVRVALPPCAEKRLSFNGIPASRIDFDVTPTRFHVEDADLVGRLILPTGAGRVPIVVLIHGSEDSSALETYALQRMFPAAGIGAFVYDKRGTGGSSGAYTQDYLTLAIDAVAAEREARRLAGWRAGRIGYQGGSQGGWVAPLAARIEPVDFVVVGFGLAVSPLQEDRSAIALDMTRHGYGPDVMAKAMQVADAVAAVLASNFQDGYDQLDAVRARYGKEPWFKDVHGDVAWLILAKSPADLRVQGPKLFADIPLHYDPMPVLQNLSAPQLWVLGEDDVDAPSAETARRLRGLAAAGQPISVAVFPHAEHGIYEYETQPDGSRLSTRQPDGYFAMMRDFILHGRLAPAYGAAMLTRAPPAP
ncbi:MAG TPA: hypothetical protein VHW60_07135 [Caulobacteraceae bacterium]|nr:hypothetical protein [Caulobacteraceae bacterium]